MKKINCSNPECKFHGREGKIVRNGKDRKGQQRWLCKLCGVTFLYDPPNPLESWQRKKPQRGIKSMRGRGELYSEVKRKYTLALTPSSVNRLDEIARSRGISRSELVEQIGRGIILLTLETLETPQALSSSVENG